MGWMLCHKTLPRLTLPTLHACRSRKVAGMMKQRSALRVELEEARNESARVGAPRIADVVAVHGDATDADALATDLVTRHHEGVY